MLKQWKTSDIVELVLKIAISALAIGAFINYRMSDTALPPQSNISVTINGKSEEIPLPPVSKTKKTYTSEAYALSFEYPDNWTVNEDVTQLDVQPPEALFSNYFTLDILEGPNQTLEHHLATRDLKKADFTIDGQEVYQQSTTGDSGTMLYFLFFHEGKAYQLHLFKDWYDLVPAIKEMIASVQLR